MKSISEKPSWQITPTHIAISIGYGTLIVFATFVKDPRASAAFIFCMAPLALYDMSYWLKRTDKKRKTIVGFILFIGLILYMGIAMLLFYGHVANILPFGR